MSEKARFSLGQSVAYKGRLYKIISAEIMGVTGWRCNLDDGQGHTVQAAWEIELS